MAVDPLLQLNWWPQLIPTSSALLCFGGSTLRSNDKIINTATETLSVMHCFCTDAEEASSAQQCHQLQCVFGSTLQAQLDLSKISDILWVGRLLLRLSDL